MNGIDIDHSSTLYVFVMLTFAKFCIEKKLNCPRKEHTYQFLFSPDKTIFLKLSFLRQGTFFLNQLSSQKGFLPWVSVEQNLC